MNLPQQPQRAAWPQIADIVPNHDGDRPTSTAELEGTSASLQFDDVESIAFEGREFVWTSPNGQHRVEYEAFRLDEGLYLVDAMPALPDRRSFTLIWDLRTARVLVVEVTLPGPIEAQSAVLERLARTGSQSAVRMRIRQGGIDGAALPPFPRSSALVGQHLRYRYSSTHLYDHIYHSEKFYSWFCREGPDQGLGDFEECDVFEVRERLYLVCWREKLLPCVGIMVEDHRIMRSVGKICGADAYTGAIENARVGALISRVAAV